MDKNNLPQNGLPKELQNIPLGQIFILTNPAMGIRAKNIYMMEFIYSMAKKYNQEYIVYATPVFYSGLWDSCICKVKTDKEMHLLISDKDSLIEMLCEFWKLDYDEVKKENVNAGRYNKITYSGENHPVRIDITPKSKSTSMMDGGCDITLQLIQNHSVEITMNKIDNIFNEIFSYGFDISWNKIKERFDYAKSKVRTYTLDIRIEKKKGFVFVEGKAVQKIKNCHISIKDNMGDEYPIKMEVMPKAIYLTFIALKKQFWIKELSGNNEFYNTFKTIYLQLPNSSKVNLPKDFNRLAESTDQYVYFVQKIGKIRDAIKDATNSNFLREQFAIEGNAQIPFGVAGATDELSALIKKEFGIE